MYDNVPIYWLTEDNGHLWSILKKKKTVTSEKQYVCELLHKQKTNELRISSWISYYHLVLSFMLNQMDILTNTAEISLPAVKWRDYFKRSKLTLSPDAREFVRIQMDFHLQSELRIAAMYINVHICFI